MLNFIDILHAFGLYYSPARHAGQSFFRQPEKQTSQTNDKTDRTGEHWVKGRLFVDKGMQIDNGAPVSEWEREGVKFKSDQINSQDRQIISAKKLDAEKYAQYKALWAEGMSISEASREATTRYGKGYARRTSETYYAAINAANHSPIT